MPFPPEKYTTFGRDIFGPFLLGYTKWLRGKIRDVQPDKVFFLSRDGFMMQRAYEILDEGDRLGVPRDYVYFSRRSLRLPLIWTKPEFGENFEFLSWQRFVSFSEVLSFWGIEDEKQKIAEETGFDLDGKYLRYEDLAQTQELRQIYESRKELILGRSKQQFDALHAYFEQIGMRGKVVIVDIGWYGSMQFCLEKVLKLCSIEAEVTGLYVGARVNKPIEGKAYGYAFETANNPNVTKLLCFFGGLEKLFQSFEGSTSAYDVNGEGKVTPRLEPFEYDMTDSIVESVRSLQSGALSFVRENPDFNGDCLSPLFAVGMNPSREQLAMFMPFYNIDNGLKVFYLPQKSIFRFSPREFLLALSQSPWKTGFLKQALKLPLPYHTIYKLLKK